MMEEKKISLSMKALETAAETESVDDGGSEEE